MRIVRQLTYLVRSVFRKRAMDAELREELTYHVDRDIAERVQAGTDPAEARRLAHARFGGVTHTTESTTDARGTRWLDDLRTDVRYAARLMRRTPGFSALTILIAAVGIGATTLVFSAVNGVLIRPLPFEKPDRLAMLTFRGPDRTPSTPDDEVYSALSQPGPAFASVGGYALASAVLSDAGEPRNADIERVTPSLFTTLGVSAAIGRTFTDREADADEPVVTLGHAFWRQHFAGDSSVIGRTIRLDGAPFVVIGVMPAGFAGPLLRGPDIYRPLRFYPLQSVNGRTMRPSIVVRLKDGLTLAATQASLGATMRFRGVQVISGESVPLTPQLFSLEEIVAGDVTQPLLVLLAAVGFVLALVIANVATLLLARTAAREREMAMRRALGASRGRQVRQVLTETLALTGIGGALGVMVARFGLLSFQNAGVDVLPRVADISLDWRVLVVAALLTFVCGLLAGLLPALTSTHGNMTFASKPESGATGRRRDGWRSLRATFVVIEVAVSVVLVVGAGLIIKGFLRVAPSEPGFAVEHRAALAVQLHDSGAYEDATRTTRLKFAQDVARRVAAVRDVRAVAFATFVPLVRSASIRDVTPDAGPSEPKRTPVRSFEHPVSPNYFDVLGIPIVAGRGVADADAAGAELVAVINQTAAARWWQGVNPIGRTFSFNAGRGQGVRTIRVVGVARDVRFEGTDTRTRPEFFVPYAQAPTQSLNFIVATAGDPLANAQALKEQVWAVDPRQPVDDLESLIDIAGESVRGVRFYSVFMAGFAVVALSIAAAGMFGMLSYMVAGRTREIGIRLALGAPRRSISGLVLRQCVMVAAAGLAGGIVVARMLTRFLTSLLLEVSPTDAKVFAAAAVGVLIVAVAASMAPALRAAAVDPITSLRGE